MESKLERNIGQLEKKREPQNKQKTKKKESPQKKESQLNLVEIMIKFVHHKMPIAHIGSNTSHHKIQSSSNFTTTIKQSRTRIAAVELKIECGVGKGLGGKIEE